MVSNQSLGGAARFSDSDRKHMERALRLANRARLWARPNPHVGCVIANGDEVIGEGFTQPAGDDHAEVQALKRAGERAKGATAFVTLEPCSHTGSTPPCAEALRDAGIARVVAALEDPNPLVSGAGFQLLSDASITVDCWLLEDEARSQLAGFLQRHQRGRGRVRAKLAMSLDGRTAMATGESQWITGDVARLDVQQLRAESCAIITGIGTVLHDDCALTVRDEEVVETLLPDPSRRALRVVVDSELRTPPGARVLQGEQPALIAHAEQASVPGSLQDIDRLPLPAAAEGVALDALLQALSERECNEILLESGPALAGAFLRAGLIDELIVYVAPKLLGSSARPLLDLPLTQMADAVNLRLTEQRQVGEDLRLTYEPDNNTPPPTQAD